MEEVVLQGRRLTGSYDAMMVVAVSLMVAVRAATNDLLSSSITGAVSTAGTNRSAVITTEGGGGLYQ